jgi:hypothetical protein
MVSMFGRGFDSRQLHDQAANKHPRKGVFALRKPMKTCFHKVFEKAKKTMRSMVVVSYLQD